VVLNGFGDAREIAALRERLAGEYRVGVMVNGADIARSAEVRAMVTEVTRAFGAVDVLVANAGIQHTASAEEFPDERWDAIVATDLSSNLHAIKAVLPHMRRRNWARIVNIASAHGLVASQYKIAYVAAKHGVVALETATTGITCNAIWAGWVLTPLVQKQIDDVAARERISGDVATAGLLGAKQPSLAFATPEQIGALAVSLCSKAAAQIPGVALPIDGGWVGQ
jgi:3-hydroxybutyrate dehydrogenase